MEKLDMELTRNNKETLLELSGRMDTLTAPMLNGKMQEILTGTQVLIIDLQKLKYISSAGLRVLLRFHKAMNRQGQMVIRNVDDTILEIFDITGFSDILHIQ